MFISIWNGDVSCIHIQHFLKTWCKKGFKLKYHCLKCEQNLKFGLFSYFVILKIFPMMKVTCMGFDNLNMK
jgi:hypothetical protein